ncbi:MAG: ExbD/TolR family protein [Candidatus Methylacidiphilales bacterium]
MNTPLDLDDSSTEISLAPLIDCVFLLLIFFLLATSFATETPEQRPLLNLAEKRLPLELPETDLSMDKESVLLEGRELLIEIDAGGSVYVDGNPVTTNALHEQLRSLSGSGIEVAIRADRATDYGHIVRILELLQFHDLNKIGFRTVEKTPYLKPKTKGPSALGP